MSLKIEDKFLLNTFTDRLREELVTRAIAAIRPEVESAARAVIAEIEPQLHKHFDVMAERLVIQLSMGDSPTITGRAP